jgi:hypothetical protein
MYYLFTLKLLEITVGILIDIEHDLFNFLHMAKINK